MKFTWILYTSLYAKFTWPWILYTSLYSSAHASTTAMTFTNAEGFIQCSIQKTIRPSSIKEIQNIISEAYSENSGMTIKPSGAGHSTNPIICSESGGIIIQMDGMNEMVKVEGSLVTVQAGAGLVKFFKDMIPYNLTIEGMVDYGAITVAGICH